MGLNPFVQVFYSNLVQELEEKTAGKKVLIPLFRSFILIKIKALKEYDMAKSLNPFVQVFYSNVEYSDVESEGFLICLNPFVQVFYSNLEKQGAKRWIKGES